MKTAEPTFFPADTPPLSRSGDRPTSRAAGESQRPKLSALQLCILGHLVVAGLRGLTDKELEQKPEFAKYAPSTVRKRRCDLLHRKDVEPLLDAVGAEVERDGLTVWVVTGLQRRST